MLMSSRINMFKLNLRKNKQIPVGIWEINHTVNQWFCVWFNDENVPQSLIVSQLDEVVIMNKIAESFPQCTTIQLKFITAILPHKIFLKTLILPYDISPKELETQCIITLEENLPLSLNEIWFDFMDRELPKNQADQSRRIDIFAVIKEIALQTIATYKPVNVQVLDCALNALLRGFHYFSSPSEEEKYDALYLYRDDDFTIIFVNQPYGWLYQVKKNINPLILINAFCLQHNITPKYHFINDCTQSNYSYPSEYTQIITPLSLIALGCALWEGGKEGI